MSHQPLPLVRPADAVEPVSPGKNSVMLTREYETNARNISRAQAALAAARLARLLNDALK